VEARQVDRDRNFNVEAKEAGEALKPLPGSLWRSAEADRLRPSPWHNFGGDCRSQMLRLRTSAVIRCQAMDLSLAPRLAYAQPIHWKIQSVLNL